MASSRVLGLVVFSFLVASCSTAPKPVPTNTFWDGAVLSEPETRIRPVTSSGGMVVSDDRLASEWGATILRQGGNAIDAAVATAFALAVTRPNYASLGGGGFFVYCPAPKSGKSQPCQTIDYREKAPAKSTRDMFLKNGKPDSSLSTDTPLAIGVPGVTAGLLLALEKFGTLPRAKLLQWPIQAAKVGFRFTGHEEFVAQAFWKYLSPGARKIFGCKGVPCAVGETIRQPDLARVFEAVSEKGRNGFYSGWVASKLVDGVQAGGGILSATDLSDYRPELRAPVVGSYRDFEVVSMPPPSSGGAILLQLLKFAELADRDGAFSNGYADPNTMHALSHAMALGFADRAKHFGDPKFYPVPLEGLLADAYLHERWKSFRANRKVVVDPGAPMPRPEPDHTTHFSVVDRFGNAVAVTTTLNRNFGSGFVAPGTGVVLNNQMDDFSIAAGVPNQFGLIGGEANAIAPGKRPLSSMSPTILRDHAGNARIVIGAAGGPRIITAVFESLVNRLRFSLSLPEAVSAPRFHMQWQPDVLTLEARAFSTQTQSDLRRLGYTLEETPISGSVHALERFENGRVWGIADPRGEGEAVAE